MTCQLDQILRGFPPVYSKCSVGTHNPIRNARIHPYVSEIPQDNVLHTKMLSYPNITHTIDWMKSLKTLSVHIRALMSLT